VRAARQEQSGAAAKLSGAGALRWRPAGFRAAGGAASKDTSPRHLAIGRRSASGNNSAVRPHRLFRQARQAARQTAPRPPRGCTAVVAIRDLRAFPRRRKAAAGRAAKPSLLSCLGDRLSAPRLPHPARRDCGCLARHPRQAVSFTPCRPSPSRRSAPARAPGARPSGRRPSGRHLHGPAATRTRSTGLAFPHRQPGQRIQKRTPH